MPKKKQKTVVRIENSKEYKQLVNESLEEMDQMTKLVQKQGVSIEEAREKVAAMYLRNLQQSDDLVALAKKNVAELMTRIQLDRSLNPEDELVSDKYIKLFKLQNEALQLIAKMEPREIRHSVQIDDDKMTFDVKEGVYDEKDL